MKHTIFKVSHPENETDVVVFRFTEHRLLLKYRLREVPSMVAAAACGSGGILND